VFKLTSKLSVAPGLLRFTGMTETSTAPWLSIRVTSPTGEADGSDVEGVDVGGSDAGMVAVDRTGSEVAAGVAELHAARKSTRLIRMNRKPILINSPVQC
jgi:hypothetical protein